MDRLRLADLCRDYLDGKPDAAVEIVRFCFSLATDDPLFQRLTTFASGQITGCVDLIGSTVVASEVQDAIQAVAWEHGIGDPPVIVNGGQE